jgi:hypothetical protein
VTNVKGLDYELVAQKNSLQLYIRDHGESIDMSKAQAKVTLLSGADKQEVELKPNGKKLEAAGNFKVSAGTSDGSICDQVKLGYQPSQFAQQPLCSFHFSS